MDSVGVFLEKEINGKPFYIFTLSSPYNELSLHRFICPELRLRTERLKQKEGNNTDAYPFTISPYLIESNYQMITSIITYEDICKHTLLPLFSYDINHIYNKLYCYGCMTPAISTHDYYKCEKCNDIIHRECVESPLFIKHPSFPFLSFQLYNIDQINCIVCDTLTYRMAYYCPTLKIAMHPCCAFKPIPIVINHLKRHPHPLTFFPRHASLVCNVCGIIKLGSPTYVCARCDFVAHQDCIYFPYVIRISRHQHRISFTYSLPSGNWSCGVCRKKIDNYYYGAYSCNTCDGGYFVHTRCALRRDLWDGEELEGVPEVPEIVVDPFLTIADGIILHFSHGHNLQLFTIGKIYDENKYCQACVLPIYKGTYYSCVSHCDYILHEKCANAPLKKHNPLHAHSLTLNVVTNEYINGWVPVFRPEGHFECNACGRTSCGFVYEKINEDKDFRLDLRCASVSEPFEYQGHEHPLFLSLNPTEEYAAICQICQEDSKYLRKLNCIECNYVICFRCATLPFKARYKHDKHFLTFKKEEVMASDDSSEWCEACEKKILYSEKGGFYACDEYCCTTLHVDCLLGTDLYMKPGQTIKYYSRSVAIHRNNTLTRPLCSECNKRCQHKVVFKEKGETFCSVFCMKNH